MYKLDFVVEGQGDHRLAIECDGDPYHGPDRWADDMRRQKALERLGWIFWRVWGSHWYSDREGCIRDLLATLERLSIAPLGADVLSFDWTEHRVVSSQLRTSTTEEKEEKEQAIQENMSDMSGAVAASFTVPTGPVRREVDILKALTNGGAKIGDFVVVRYNDTNKLRRILLSGTENDPDQGIMHVKQPLGAAILGADVDDEIEFPQGKGIRTAVIERIERV